ncbi:uncharacterized protein LOC119101669 [Pollicipes pollicipes]|uniref:uncharacterized protein LOC119101654 n=1 Tax=Pollicipes pollicipes TaxID=41117 RepID=UPI0018850C62|nr:uncharacterized protein LOC119101654 [Pollicipes pollicipes]XP_037080977.1 uncharacterized protein LOC119101669 [Pollicipes pollicipes]
MMLFNLPVELHEKILGYLHDLDLMSASQVCQLWHQLSEGFCRRSVQNQVPDDVLEELRTELTPAADELAGEQPDADGRWTELYRRWMQSQLRCQRPWRVRNTHYFPFTVLAMFADGSRLFAADSEGVLTVQNMKGRLDLNPSHRLYLHDGHINQIVPVWRLRLLVVTGADTHFILDGAPPRLLMCTENMSGQRRVSVHGDQLATMKDVYQRTCITVYRMSVDERWTRLEPLYDVHCPHAAFQWSLWRDQLVCFLRSGELCVWDQAAAAWHRHPDAYTELRYENPAWVVRDTVLCSTLVQRQLMGYWHQDRDFTYWLQGRVCQPLVRAAPAFNENILCLCARRSLVVAGTQSGKLLFFHSGVRDRGVPGLREPDRSCVSDVKLTAPVCVISLGFNAIEGVALGFSDHLVSVFVKSRKNMVELIEVAVANLFR